MGKIWSIRTGLMRLAACALMVLVGAVDGRGGTFAIRTQPSERFKLWSKQQVEKIRATKDGQQGMRLMASSLTYPDIGAEPNRFGAVPSPIDNRYLTRGNRTGARATAVKYDIRYDLREKGWVTSVKDQGNYGTCWTHATMASLESWILKTEGITKDYSENNLANLHGFDWAYSNGGNGYMATAYLTRWGGPILESVDPYGRPLESVYSKPDRHVQHVRIITPKKEGDNTANDEIKRAIMEYGALYVNYWADGWYMGADGQSFNGQASEFEIWYYTDVLQSPCWHAVALVGWDDDYPKENFADVDYGLEAAEGNGAYIIKNSWGAGAGDEGYYYISYYDTQFARDEIFAFASAESKDNYEKVYEYDPLGYSGSLYGFETCKGWGANIFTATGDDVLAAVGFYARMPNTSYTINVYTNVTRNAGPIDGKLAMTKSGITDFNNAGYFTIPFGENSGVRVNTGDRFSIVMEIQTPDSYYPIPMEYVYFDTDENGQEYETYNSAVTASAGQSFFSENGTKWYDLNLTTVNYSDGSVFLGKYRPNFCCKVYTKSQQSVAPTLTKVEIEGDSSTIAAGKTATFKCKATNSYGSPYYVRGSWTVRPGGYATLSVNGNNCVVTAAKVTESTVIGLTVTYEENGVSKSDTWNNIIITVDPPSVPTCVTAAQGESEGDITVNWNCVDGAEGYVIYRGNQDAVTGDNAAYVKRVALPPFNDTSLDLVAGKTYSYFVRAENKSGKSDYSQRVHGWKKLAKPNGLRATKNKLDKVVVSWGEVEGATHYHVYRAESRGGEKEPLGTWRTDKECNDTPPEAGKEYFYYVVAAVDANGTRPSDFSDPVPGMMALPVTVDYLELKGDANITSGACADYTADAIYTDGHRVANVAPDRWDIVGEGASVVNGRVTADVVTENKTVVLKASYTEDGKTARGEKSITIAAVKPSVPTGLVADLTSQGVTIIWNAVAGAASYKVYRADSANAVATQIGMTAGTSYPDTSAMPGVAYTYSVSAVNGAGESERSGGVVVTVPLAAPTGVAATSDRTDGVNVKWSAVNGATHYRVARATSPTGAKTQLGSWQAGTAYLDTSATAETTYYYFVRAATSSSGANANEYSTPAAPGMRIPSRTLLSVEISGMDKVPASKSAVYTCVATYSDETTETVTPTWSVSPTSAATINENGLLMANAVSANCEVTVAASFTDGTTKTANKAVTIVAPEKATAEIENMVVSTRWPFAPIVDIDYTLVVNPASAKAIVGVVGHDEDHGIDMAATTLSGDGADGSYIAAGVHRLTWNIGADYPNFHAKAFSVSMTATPSMIGVPENVTAVSTRPIKDITVSWDAADISDVTYRILRGRTDSIGSAQIIATTSSSPYVDSISDLGDYYYWVVAVLGDMSVTSGVAKAEFSVNLLPLRNVLNVIEQNDGVRDGIVSDIEMTRAMKHANIVDMDGDKKNISAAEMAILERIQVLNQDKDLIAQVIAGNYTGISMTIIEELQDLSDTILELTKLRNN